MVVSRLASLSPGDVFVASMTEAELRFGALNSAEAEANGARVLTFLEPMEILPFDSEAAGHHARIRFALERTPIGERDLVIASVAASRGLTLVTDNVREFSRVEGLRVESWAAEGAT